MLKKNWVGIKERENSVVILKLKKIFIANKFCRGQIWQLKNLMGFHRAHKEMHKVKKKWPKVFGRTNFAMEKKTLENSYDKICPPKFIKSEISPGRPGKFWIVFFRQEFPD